MNVEACQPVPDAADVSSTKAKHDNFLAIVRELDHFRIFIHECFPDPAFDAARLSLACRIVTEERRELADSADVRSHDDTDTSVVTRARDDVRISPARASVISVSRGTFRAAARERESTLVVPRTLVVVGSMDVEIA